MQLSTTYWSVVKSYHIRFLARLSENDNRTTLERTLSTSLKKLVEDDLSRVNFTVIKQKLCYRAPPDEESWRLSLGSEFLRIRDGNDLELSGFTKQECEDLLYFACTSWRPLVGHSFFFFSSTGPQFLQHTANYSIIV